MTSKTGWSGRGSTGTPSCGTALTPGTLTAAQYTQSFSYDALNRLTAGPLGRYTYGVGMENAGQTPLDAAQYIGNPGQLSPPAVPSPSAPRHPGTEPQSGQQQSQQPGNQRGLASLPPPGSAPPYSASYNANGEMVCRSTSTTMSQSCYGGNDGGAQLSYDAEGQLVHWQNAPGTSPTSTVNTLYDGEGNRVEQQVGQWTCGQACGMTYTTTQYVAGGIEEVAQQGGTSPSTTTTKYYSAGGLLVGVRVNGTMSYLASDGLGSVSAALSSSGSVTAAQLFAPYGGGRYASGTMPTARGFTGQYSDVATTGLMDYGARFYDPLAGQFTSADLVQGPNRYGYVAGNPTTATDPSGHERDCGECEDTGDMALLYGDDFTPQEWAEVQAAEDWELTVNGDVADNWGDGWHISDYGSSDTGYSVSNFQGDVTITDTENGEGVQTGETITTTADGTVTTETFSSDDLAAGEEAASEDAQAAKLAEGNYAEQKMQAEENPPQKPPTTEGHPPSGPNGPGGCGESFAPGTMVATPQGEQPIGTLHVGDQVLAYDPATKGTSSQTVQQVYVDHDTDLLDVTLRTTADNTASKTSQDPPAGAHGTSKQSPQSTQSTPQGQSSTSTSRVHKEIVHTTASHPWLTADRGWARAGALHVGERVVRADGSTALVVAVHVVPGAANMWDLTVSRVHTFAVGIGQFVVHNCGSTGTTPGTGDPQNYVGTYRGAPIYKGPAVDDASLQNLGAPTSTNLSNRVSGGFADFVKTFGSSPSDWWYQEDNYLDATGQKVENHFWFSTKYPDVYHHH